MSAVAREIRGGDVRTATKPADMIANIVAFQIGWFACVLSAAHGWPWAGTATAVAVVAWHAARAERPAQELKLIITTVLIGALWDSALTALGWITYPSGTLIAGAAPHWMLGLWALFATTLNVSLNWLKGRWLLAATLGAVAGPLSYWGGARLGALEFTDPVRALAALAVGWAILTPALLALASRYDGIHKAN